MKEAISPREAGFLLPILSSGWVGVLKGVRPELFSHLGFEVVLSLGAFVPNPSVFARWSALVVAIAALLCTGSVAVTVGLFGSLSAEDAGRGASLASIEAVSP